MRPTRSPAAVPVERREAPGDELEHPDFVLRAAGRERCGVPEREGEQLAAVPEQRGVADAKIARERDLASEVHAGRELVGELPALLEPLRQLVPRRRQQLGRRRDPAWHVVDERHRERSRNEPDAAVEADVLDGARHRLEPDGASALPLQPVGPGGIDKH